jgi:hypothetical protein
VKGYAIWVEAEVWPDQWVPSNTNSDVVVTRDDGSIWTATFFSYENIAALRLKNQETGECLNGRYMWATNMILVDEVTRTRVEEVVADLVATHKFESAFDGPHEPAV